jgi:transaldolase
VIWASCRELFNVVQADSIGCHVITVPNDIIKKLDNLGRDLREYSLDTVKTFYNDGLLARFKL